MTSEKLNVRLADLTPDQRAALAKRLSATKGIPALRRRPGPRDVYPMGLDQERLWMLDQLNPGATTYCLSFAMRFVGSLDVPALLEAVKTVVRRHESLRSVVVVERGAPSLRVLADMPAAVRVLDLSDVSAEERDRRLAEVMHEQVSEPFDLSAGPLLRFAVVRLGEAEYQVCETMHHSTADQFSYLRLNRELLECYRAQVAGGQPKLPDLPVQIGDFTHWQREVFSGEGAQGRREFWRQYLAGYAGNTPLPYDMSPDTNDHAGAHHQFLLDESAADRFREFTKTAKTTLSTSLLAVYAALLFEETGARDIVIGQPSVTRGAPESRDLIGFLLTNVPVRIRLPEHPSPRDVLAAAIAAERAIVEHREVPFVEIVEAVSPQRSATQHPLLQTMHLLLGFSETVFELPGLAVHTTVMRDEVSPMDITVGWWQSGNTLYGRLEYRTALFSAATIDRMVRRLLQLVELFADRPDDPLHDSQRRPTVAAPPSALASPIAHHGGAPAAKLDLATRAWVEVLATTAPTPDASFFQEGGTSLLAVELVDRLRAAGFTASVRDVFTHQTLGALAAALPLAGQPDTAETAAHDAVAPLSPEQQLLLDMGLEDVELWAHTKVLVARSPLGEGRIREAVEAIFAAHPALGAVFEKNSDSWTARPGGMWTWAVESPDADLADVITRQRAGFDMRTGRLFAASLIPGSPDRLVLSASHLCMDGMSWQIIVDDLMKAFRRDVLAPETEGAFDYARELRKIDDPRQLDYWAEQHANVRPMSWAADTPNRLGDVAELEVEAPLPMERSDIWQIAATTAAARLLLPWTEQVVFLMIELGRERLASLPMWDAARAVGFYACFYPLHLPVSGDDPAKDLGAVGEALRRVPDGGKCYGLLRCAPDSRLRLLPMPFVSFNYLGRIGAADDADRLFDDGGEFGPSGNEGCARVADLEILAAVRGDTMVFRWRYNPKIIPEPTVRAIAERAGTEFAAIIESSPAIEPTAQSWTLSDAQMNSLMATLSQRHREKL
jgi:non-ribosomal peptide synthase protein (TIGR01720 family)